MQLADAIKRRDKQDIWLNMGILLAFIGTPEHFLVEFKIDENGHHDPESVLIAQNPYDTVEETYKGYSKEIRRVRDDLRTKIEVHSERASPIPDFDAVFGNRPDLLQPRTVLHRH